MHDPDQEVRRCQRCREVAVVSSAAWRHTHMGIDTGVVTRDYRCQACGHRFKVRPRARLMGFYIAGVLLLPTCVGVPILAVAWWWSQADSRNPVVPGAPRPALQYRAGPPARKCAACGGLTLPRTITQNRINGLPAGVEVDYACTACSHTFTIESPLGQAMNLLSGALVGAIGAALLVYAEHPGWRFGGGGIAVLLGLFMVGMLVARASARVRNPVVPDGLR